MQQSKEAKLAAFSRLLDIMDDLRAQCPWDKKQTIHTLRNLTIEETYELTDAITKNDWKGIQEELGDILLHMIFYSKIGEEQSQFSIADVLNAQCEKLIHRHPHIYGDVQVKDEEEVKRNWEKLKLKEGKRSVLQGVPDGLPALIKAYRIQEKAAQVKFEWEHADQVWEKVEEEMQELHKAYTQQEGIDRIEDELGDVFFALVNMSRFMKADPENAVERTNQKFIKRFRFIEEQALLSGKELQNMTLAEMDALWNEAKEKLST